MTKFFKVEAFSPRIMGTTAPSYFKMEPDLSHIVYHGAVSDWPPDISLVFKESPELPAVFTNTDPIIFANSEASSIAEIRRSTQLLPITLRYGSHCIGEYFAWSLQKIDCLDRSMTVVSGGDWSPLSKSGRIGLVGNPVIDASLCGDVGIFRIHGTRVRVVREDPLGDLTRFCPPELKFTELRVT